jgi:poly(A) polymerase
MSSKSDWKQLFIGIPFFDRYKHYIILLLSASDQYRFLKWSGLVESKIHLFIRNLERNLYIDTAHVSSDKYTPDESVFEQQQQQTNGHDSPGLESSSTNVIQQSTKSPSNTTNTPNTFSGMWVVGLQFSKNVNKVQLDLTDEIRIFRDVVFEFATKSNMNRDNINLDARYIRRRDLHTVLPKHLRTTLNQSPRLSKTNFVDEKLDMQLKRSKSNSISSDTGIGSESDLETTVKGPKLAKSMK